MYAFCSPRVCAAPLVSAHPRVCAQIKWLIHNKCPLIIAQIDNLKSAVEEHPWIKKQGKLEKARPEPHLPRKIM